MNPSAYLTNMVLRTKKYRKLSGTFTHRFTPCSIGNSILAPIETPPASDAPRLAASMMPGPPPVIVPSPAFASRLPTSRAALYIGWLGATRADPKIVTAGPTSARASKPATNSPMIRKTRQVSLCVKAAARSRSSWSHAKRRLSSVGLPVRAATLIVGLGIIGSRLVFLAPLLFGSLGFSGISTRILPIWTALPERTMAGLLMEMYSVQPVGPLCRRPFG